MNEALISRAKIICQENSAIKINNIIRQYFLKITINVKIHDEQNIKIQIKISITGFAFCVRLHYGSVQH